MKRIFASIFELRSQNAVFNCLLGIGWFWFIGAASISIMPGYVKSVLAWNEMLLTFSLATLVIGLAIGAVICERLSFERVELGLVPLGAFGMSACMAGLYYFRFSPVAVYSQIFLMSLLAGFYVVPLFMFLQQRSLEDQKVKIVSSGYVLNSLFAIASMFVVFIFQIFHFSNPEIFLVLSIFNLLVAIYIFTVVPEFALRFLMWGFTHLMYRVKMKGHEYIPKEGPVVLVCNHVSFVDWLIIGGWVKRPVRFVMYYKFMKMPFFSFFLKAGKVIPIAGQNEDPEIFKKAFEAISHELKAGEVVCIFPEGTLTKSGEMNTFKAGIEHIIKRDPVPVVPMALRGLWGSIFSHKDGKAMAKMPRRILFPVDLVMDRAVPAEQVTAAYLQGKVAELLK